MTPFLHPQAAVPKPAPANPNEENTHPIPATGPGRGLLSPALPFSELANDASYVLMDDKGRVLCSKQQGEWDWAYMGDFNAYHSQVLYFSVSTARIGKETVLRSTHRDKAWNFYVNHNGWLFTSAQRWPGYPMMELHFANTRHDSNQFTLEFDFGAGPLALTAENGTWNYLRTAGPEHAMHFTLHRYYVPGRSLADLISETWPEINTELLHEVDRPYLGISAHHAEQIWNDSKLDRYQWRDGSFDSDDFAFIYKAQASLDAYHGNLPHPYAVGWVSGANAAHRHTANLFMDLNGRLNTLDPQTGEVAPAASWPFAPTRILI
ncbi:lectin MOA-related protein [Pseudomonas mosselii]|uniref:Lectin MOA-related protein n=1 Tax=Pseudomonas mosselii TaxID=78327 RepID=A0AA42RYW4_9PSED|nr:lectin MOA-related protein [Pseudomonas mosselii]MDH1633004.1 lectin MOA-related protein [Pseudomonas mosselii]